MSVMTPQQAIQYLINAIQVGQKRGAWNLQEAATLQQVVTIAKDIRFPQEQKVPVRQERAQEPKVSMQPEKEPSNVSMKTERVSLPPSTVSPNDIDIINDTRKLSDEKMRDSVKRFDDSKQMLNNMLPSRKILSNLNSLHDTIKKQHKTPVQLNPKILGLDGPIGPEVPIESVTEDH